MVWFPASVEKSVKVRNMNVILLESVENLGGIGDLVKVKPGYGRNYLLWPHPRT